MSEKLPSDDKGRDNPRRIFQAIRFGFRSVLFISLIAFWFASHTVSVFSELSSAAIRAVTGLTTTTQGAREELNRERLRTQTQTQRAADLDRQLTQARGELDETRTLLRRSNERVADFEVRLTRSQSQLARAQTELADLRTQRAVAFRGRMVQPREAMLEVAEGIERRTARAAAANAGAVVGEAIPFYGVGVIVAVTALELTLSCDTMNDLYELRVALEPGSAVPDDRSEVCGLQVPTRGEAWAQILASPETAWNASVSAVNSTSEFAMSLEPPDFGQWWARAVGLFARFSRDLNDDSFSSTQ